MTYQMDHQHRPLIHVKDLQRQRLDESGFEDMMTFEVDMEISLIRRLDSRST
jgi:hypothetical protein